MKLSLCIYCTIIPSDVDQFYYVTHFTTMPSQKQLEIPDELYNMTQLTYIHFWNNKIEYISSKIGNLIKLQNLNLYGNLISVLPKEIVNLINLYTLNLGSNLISALPQDFHKLKNLKELYIYYNPHSLDYSRVPQHVRVYK